MFWRTGGKSHDCDSRTRAVHAKKHTNTNPQAPAKVAETKDTKLCFPVAAEAFSLLGNMGYNGYNKRAFVLKAVSMTDGD